MASFLMSCSQNFGGFDIDLNLIYGISNHTALLTGQGQVANDLEVEAEASILLFCASYVPSGLAKDTIFYCTR